MSERPGLSRNVSAARSRHRLRLGPDGRNFGRGGKGLPPGACALRGRAPESRTFRARDANGREASEPSPHIGLRGYRTRRGQRDCRAPQKWSRSNCNATHRARRAPRRGEDGFTLRQQDPHERRRRSRRPGHARLRPRPAHGIAHRNRHDHGEYEEHLARNADANRPARGGNNYRRQENDRRRLVHTFPQARCSRGVAHQQRAPGGKSWGRLRVPLTPTLFTSPSSAKVATARRLIQLSIPSLLPPELFLRYRPSPRARLSLERRPWSPWDTFKLARRTTSFPTRPNSG